MHVNKITKTGYKVGSKGITMWNKLEKKVHSKLRVQGWGVGGGGMVLNFIY